MPHPTVRPSGCPIEIVAHRRASIEAPENTLAAVELAWQFGADAVEIDVQLTGDVQHSGSDRPDQLLPCSAS